MPKYIELTITGSGFTLGAGERSSIRTYRHDGEAIARARARPRRPHAHQTLLVRLEGDQIEVVMAMGLPSTPSSNEWCGQCGQVPRPSCIRTSVREDLTS